MQIVNFGKFKLFPKKINFINHYLPQFYYITKEENNLYTTTCMTLRIDGTGENEKDSILNMINNCAFFIVENFKNYSREEAWDNLEECLYESIRLKDEWDAYSREQLVGLRNEYLIHVCNSFVIPSNLDQKNPSVRFTFSLEYQSTTNKQFNL